MATYVPPGWPTGVHPPGSEEFEQTAVAWLLDVVPPDYRLHGVLRRHPVALAALARHHLAACVAGAREGYRTARAELGDYLPPGSLDAVLDAYRTEGRRLVETAQAVDLVRRALRGEMFTPQMAGTQDGGRSPSAKRDPARRNEKQRPTSYGEAAPAKRSTSPGEAEPAKHATNPGGAALAKPTTSTAETTPDKPTANNGKVASAKRATSTGEVASAKRTANSGEAAPAKRGANPRKTTSAKQR